MRRCFLVTAVVLFGFMSSAAPAAEPAPVGLRWQRDLMTAHQISVSENKPMLLVFGAEWCTWCKKLEQSTLADPKMVTYINTAFVPVHIDVDQQRKIAEILEVQSLPCTIVLSPEADLLGRIEGFESPGVLYKKLVAAKDLQSRVAPASGTASP